MWLIDVNEAVTYAGIHHPDHRPERLKALRNFKRGDFVQTRYRVEGSLLPPPVHYIGSTQQYNVDGDMELLLLSLDTFKWHEFYGSIQVCNLVPKITEEQKLSIIPYMDLEPSFSEEEFTR